LVVEAAQSRQLGILAYIKRGEPVVKAFQSCQRGILAYVKRGELVLIAFQLRSTRY